MKCETTGIYINMETCTILGGKKKEKIQVIEDYIKTNKALCMDSYIRSKAIRKRMMKKILV